MHRFKQVDVFTSAPFRGNPVAVVLQADDLSAEQMQQIATWTGLPETTFVLRPDHPGADYRLRIFNPVYELPFAGHPTLGSAFAALQDGLVPHSAGRLVQECQIGLVELHLGGNSRASRIGLTMPEAKFQSMEAEGVAELEVALGMGAAGTPMLIDVGPRWVTARLANAQAIRNLEPDMEALKRLSRRIGAVGVTVFGEHSAGAAKYEVRSFTPASAIPEDPVCGSGNGCVAAYLLKEGAAPLAYIASQGCRVGRDGYVHVAYTATGQVILAGDCITCIDGTLAV